MYEKNYVMADQAYRESLNLFEQLAENNPEMVRPNIAMLQFNLGCLYRLFLNDFEQAEKFLKLSVENYQQLIKVYPDAYNKFCAQSLAGLSLLYARNNMEEKAMLHYTQALELTSDLPDLFDARGVIEYMRGDVDKAKETWKEDVNMFGDAARENSWLYELLFPNK